MNVQISEGLRLSDENARVFSRHMLADLARIDAKGQATLHKALGSNRRTTCYNPVSQKRWWSRFLRALGPAILSQGLKTCKGPRFTAAAIFWHVSARGRLVVSKLVIDSDRVHGWDLLEFSEHALQRLIQRAGVRKAGDYLPILNDLAWPVLLMNDAEYESSRIGDDETWPLPVTVGGVKSLLLIRNMWDGDTRVPLVTTVYKGSWRDYPELKLLDAALAKGSKVRGADLAALFRAAAKPFREVGK